MRGLATFWHLELLRALQSPITLGAALVAPLAWLLLFGLAFQRAVDLRFDGFPYVVYILPGLVVLLATFLAVGSGTRTLADRQIGFLKEVLVAPVSRFEIVAGRASGVATIALAQAVVLLGAGTFLDRALPMPYGVWSVAGLVLSLALVTVAFSGLGMLMAVRGTGATGFQALLGLLNLPMFFLSGALIPIDRLPEWAQAIATVNPMAYAVDVARQATLGASTGTFPVAWAALGLFGFALLTLGFAARSLRAE